MPWNKEDFSFKRLLNRLATSSDKQYYEEFGSDTLDISAREVKTSVIPSDPAVAVTNGVAQLRTLFALTEDNTVANQQAWFADDGGRIRDWISDKYGANYRIRLFDGNDNEIFPTDASDWLFDYVTGTLVFNGNTSGFTKPFKVTGYQYIGSYLDGGGLGGSAALGYESVYYVDAVNGDDSTASINDRSSAYATINAATTAARAEFDANATRTLVYVARGTYPEASVNRNHVDMFFEDGAVVYATGSGQSVINDISEVMDDIRVTGLGTFVHTATNPVNDEEGINIRRASKMSIQAKLVDSVQVWQTGEVDLVLEDMDIIFAVLHHQNKTIVNKSCRFLNGFRTTSFLGSNTFHQFRDCDFFVPLYDTTNPLNESLDIYDFNGTLLFRISPGTTNNSPIDTSAAADLDAVISTIDSTYTVSNNTANPQCVGYMYSQNDHFFNIDDVQVEHINSRFILQKPKTIGLLLCQKRNPSGGDFGNVRFTSCQILDQSNGQTAALVSGFGVGATGQPGLMINGVSHDCTNERLPLNATNLTEWAKTYNEIDVVSVAGTVLANPESADQNQIPVTVSTDEADTGLTIAEKPIGFLFVLVNGLGVRLGNGIKTLDCYFSSDGGTTAKTFANIAAGDTLYWNSVIAGYGLDATTPDYVDFLYLPDNS